MPWSPVDGPKVHAPLSRRRLTAGPGEGAQGSGWGGTRRLQACSREPNVGLVDELERLSKLHQDGALSASQYEEAKVRLLKADDDEDSAQLGRPRTMAAVAPQTGGTTDSPTPVRWAAYVVASAGLVLWGLSHMDGRLWFGYDGPWFFVDGWTYLFAGIGAFLWWQYLASSDDAEARRRRVLRAFGITFGCTTLTVVGDNDLFVAKVDPNGD